MVMAMDAETHSSVHDFDLIGGAVCLDFVNTGSARTEGPFKERLHAYDDLLVWAERAEVISADEAADLARLAAAKPTEAELVLERGRQLREAVYRVFSGQARGESPKPADLALLSAEQAAAAANRVLTVNEGRVEFGWRIDTPNLERPLWSVAQSAADLLTASECTRVKECGTDNCNWLFLDASKNKSRRWCEMKECGNRAKARRHYAKKRGAGGSAPQSG